MKFIADAPFLCVAELLVGVWLS